MRTDIPRGTPGITTREPLAVAVSTGRKADRGFPIDTHRFFLVNARADGKGAAAVRRMHPSYGAFNALPAQDATDAERAKHDALRTTIRGVIVHATEAECFHTNYRAQTIEAYKHQKMAPSCQGNGERATRWLPSAEEFIDIPCPNEKCEFRQPGSRNGKPTRPLCTPYACLVFQLNFDKSPCLAAKYETRGFGGNAAIKGFFADIQRQAEALHVPNPSLYGIPFVLDLSRRSDAATQTKWFEVTMSTDFREGRTLQDFLLLQGEARATLSVRAPLLIGQAPTVIDVMSEDVDVAGSIGAP